MTKTKKPTAANQYKLAKSNFRMKNGHKWILLKELAFDVCADRSKTPVFPKGTKNVWVAFRASWMTRTDEKTGEKIRLNIYEKNGIVVHA